MRIMKITINYKNGEDQLEVHREEDDAKMECFASDGYFIVSGDNCMRYINNDLIGSVNVEIDDDGRGD